MIHTSRLALLCLLAGALLCGSCRSVWPFNRKKLLPTPGGETETTASKLAKPPPEKEKPAVSIDRLEKVAKAGNPNAQLALGKIYFEGRANVKQDYVEAIRWFTMAAEAGNGAAMFNLGICYENGVGVAMNPTAAYDWYRKAADSGVAEAQGKVAAIAEMRGDYQSAVKYLRLRADAGDTICQRKLGVYILNGIGTNAPASEAVTYLLKAARKGDIRAQVYLADCYQRGNGIERNYYEMFNWLTLAAQEGDPEAQTKLGYC
ncbi:MAG: sel1 repeat family protein, partial [Lentisphaerae bacterium]|nr:sel1 repeat family protein [Lentisphaerota bacterium]